jgi:hypothetical protein
MLVINVAGVGKLEFPIEKASAENRLYAEKKGWETRIVDMAAIPFEKHGRYATAQEKFAAMDAGVKWYNGTTNPWNMRGQGSSDVSLFECLVRIMEGQLDSHEVMEWLNGLDDKAKKELTKDAEVITMAAKIRVERQGPQEGVKTALAGLKAKVKPAEGTKGE